MSPLKPKPMNVIKDILHVFSVFLGWVGIVAPQVAHSTKLLGSAEVHANGLCVANVQVAVRLWGKSCLYATVVLALFQVIADYLFNEAHAALLFFFVFFNLHFRDILFPSCKVSHFPL